MKLPYYIVIFLLALFSLSSQAQEQNTAEKLIGTWTLQYDATFASIKPDTKTRFNTMNHTRQKRMINNFKGRKIIFNTNGDFIQSLADGRQSNSTWKFTSNNTTIEITDSKGRIHLYKIKKLTSNLLVYKLKENTNIKPLIPELHFVKNENL
jgi:hypothetical protein